MHTHTQQPKKKKGKKTLILQHKMILPERGAGCVS